MSVSYLPVENGDRRAKKSCYLKVCEYFGSAFLLSAFGIFYGDSIPTTQSGETGKSSSDRVTDELGFGTKRRDDDRAID